jgi:hypothetical protein
MDAAAAIHHETIPYIVVDDIDARQGAKSLHTATKQQTLPPGSFCDDREPGYVS